MSNSETVISACTVTHAAFLLVLLWQVAVLVYAHVLYVGLELARLNVA